jgi:hypothetical protein
MKEIRDIKIDLLMDNKNPIVDLFCNLTSGIEIINCDVYNKDGLEFIYHKDGQWIFYQDAKNGKFWVNYKRYWVILESYFDLEYREIQSITKLLVEKTLKREVTTPRVCITGNCTMVEEALNREVTTPITVATINGLMVEEALKRELDTPPSYSGNFMNYQVEEALKRELGPPVCPIGNIVAIEEALNREVTNL